MKFRSLLSQSALIVLCLIFLSFAASAQRLGAGAPRQERLLNGLRLVMWSDPTATDVQVRVRIHSGSAFDPQGKEGVMQLLSDNIFPTSASRSFFTDDLGGSLEVITNYDFIQINATSKPSEFVTLVETVAQAVSSPTIDKETTASLKKALAEKLAVLEKDPAYIAERAAAKRLFGTFPYGRPQMGSLESLERIDFADLQFARERFLSADNATVAISGNFNSDLGFRAARRYLGAWLKSDKRVPSTFRQPDKPDTAPLEIVIKDASGARSNFALRGVARNDPDYAASMVVERIYTARFEKYSGTISNHAYVLPGSLTWSLPTSGGFPFTVFSDKVTDAEFSKARGEVAAELAKRSVLDQWLDADTYQTTPAKDAQAFQSVTIADVQRVSDRFSKNPIVSVIVRPAE